MKMRKRKDQTNWRKVFKYMFKVYKEEGRVSLRRYFYRLYEAKPKPLLKNTESHYKCLSRHVVSWRKAGKMSDKMFIDKRTVHENFFDPAIWKSQKTFIEVFVEKDAAVESLKPICKRYNVNLTASKGFSSWSAKKRVLNTLDRLTPQGFNTFVLIYLGDFDPSGWDISRDIQDQLSEFNDNITFERLMINPMDIERYGLSPKPDAIKKKDSRYKKFVRKFGKYASELDAINPAEVRKRLTEAILKYTDIEQRADAEFKWLKDNEARAQIELGLRELRKVIYAEIMPAIEKTLVTTRENVLEGIKTAQPVPLEYDKALIQKLIQDRIKPILSSD